MRFAYADPPYLGCAKKLYGDHPEAWVYDTLEGHKALIDVLVGEQLDGWALSMTSGNLKDLLLLCPRDARVMSWVKLFAIFKPNVNPGYTWEPVIVWGGRKRTREQPTERDFHESTEEDCVKVNITLRKGLCGAKPAPFCHWLFRVLNMQPDDVFVDVLPGTGGVLTAWKEYSANYEQVRQAA